MADESNRDLLGRFRDMLAELRRHAGPIGAIVAPLQLQADLLERVLRAQAELEQRLSGAIAPIATFAELARDAPATLRTQAKAFEAASVSFKQVAEVLNLQAELLERTTAALAVPAGVLRGLRPDAPEIDPGGPTPG